MKGLEELFTDAVQAGLTHISVAAVASVEKPNVVVWDARAAYNRGDGYVAFRGDTPADAVAGALKARPAKIRSPQRVTAAVSEPSTAEFGGAPYEPEALLSREPAVSAVEDDPLGGFLPKVQPRGGA